MSLAKILAARKRKRNFYGGGDADPEGNADAGRADGSPSVGGFNGGVDPGGGGPEPGQAPGTVNPDAFTPSGGPEPGQAPGTVNPDAFTPSGGGKPGEDAMAQAAATKQDFTPQQQAEFHQSMVEVLGRQYADAIASLGVYGALAGKTGIADKIGTGIAQGVVAATPYGSTRPGSDTEYGRPNSEGGMGTGLGADAAANPFGSSTPTQTTPATPTDAGMRRYVWDPVARQYTLTNVGGGANPMGYTAGQTFRMAAGGAAPAGLAAARTQPRFVQGGGTGLSDDVPVKMDDGGDGRLADGEFVIPADVVSGLGGGSSKAGADMLYQMMERIRQAAHGKSQQIRPVDPGRVLPA